MAGASTDKGRVGFFYPFWTPGAVGHRNGERKVSGNARCREEGNEPSREEIGRKMTKMEKKRSKNGFFGRFLDRGGAKGAPKLEKQGVEKCALSRGRQ